MAGFSIDDIKAKLEFGGARPSLFKVVVTLPDALQYAGKGVFNNKIEFMCRAASIPVGKTGTIEVPYLGRTVKYNGNRRFDDWQITIINDEDFAIRDAFEFWSSAINGHRSNVTNSGVTSRPSTYKSIAVVRQFSKDDQATTPVRKYRFEGLWPSEVAAIDLNWGNENEIEEFTVTLAYDLWEVDRTAE